MSALTGLHGTVALIILATLLYAEESGVPLPLLPGDAILIGGGLLIQSGAVSPWAFFPVAFAAVLGGALTAYGWARVLGSRGLAAVAERLHASTALDRALRRLHSAGPLGVVVGRLLPGTRVYTTMVAGAIGMELRVFLTGAIPSIALWIAGFTLGGVLVGVPAVHFLGRVQEVAFGGGLLLAFAVLGYLSLRHIPAAARRDESLFHTPRRGRVAMALALDGSIVVAIVSGIEELLGDVLHAGDPDGLVDFEILAAAVVLCYVIVSRRGAGATAGESLLDVSYRYRRARRG